MISILMTFSSNASWSDSLFSKLRFKAKTPSHGPKYRTRSKVDSQLEMHILLNRDDSTEKVNKNPKNKLKKRAMVSTFHANNIELAFSSWGKWQLHCLSHLMSQN